MKRIFILLMALLVLISISACGDSENSSANSRPGNQESGDSSSDTSDDANTVYKANLPESLNYEGERIVILSSYGGDVSTVQFPFFGGEGEIEESVVNDAVLNRNYIVESLLGVTIHEEMMSDTNRYGGGSLNDRVSQAVNSSLFSFNIISASLYNCASMSASGYLADMMKLEYLDELSAPWWNKSFISEVEIAGSVYYATGDVSMGDVAGIFCLVFNKAVLERIDGVDPYELVKSGQWDYDTYITMAATILRDANSDGKFDYNDDIGIVGQSSMLWALIYGSGERIASTAENGYPALTIYNERSVNMINNMVEYLSDRSHLCSANDYFGITGTPITLIEENFKSDKSLFYGTSLGSISKSLSDMKSDFGVLPYPKYSQDQESYYSLVSPWTGNAVSLPFGMDDETESMTAAVLEAMGAEGKNCITDAYCETMLKDQKTRDEDSRKMIDIIISTAGCDLGHMFQFGKFSTTFQQMVINGDSDFTSKYDAAQASAAAAIEQVVSTYKELQNS